MSMIRPIFTLHAGEYLVGNYIYENLSDEFDVWVPGKDNAGIDLLLTPKHRGLKSIGLQVKFSRDFENPKLIAGSWFALNPEKIKESSADYWVFVIHALKGNIQFIIVPTNELIRRIPVVIRNKKWNLYLNVCDERTCRDERNRKKPIDYSMFLNNWKALSHFLRSTAGDRTIRAARAVR